MIIWITISIESGLEHRLILDNLRICVRLLWNGLVTEWRSRCGPALGSQDEVDCDERTKEGIKPYPIFSRLFCHSFLRWWWCPWCLANRIFLVIIAITTRRLNYFRFCALEPRWEIIRMTWRSVCREYISFYKEGGEDRQTDRDRERWAKWTVANDTLLCGTSHGLSRVLCHIQVNYCILGYSKSLPLIWLFSHRVFQVKNSTQSVKKMHIILGECCFCVNVIVTAPQTGQSEVIRIANEGVSCSDNY